MYMEKGPKTDKLILTIEKKGRIVPSFKAYHNAAEIKAVLYKYKNRHVNQWNK